MKKAFWGALLAAALVGCAGGGDGRAGDDSPRSTAVTATFPLKQAYESYLSQANVYSYSLSGTCGGSGSETTSAPTASTFQGSPALVKTSTVRVTRDSCVADGPNLTPVAPPGTEVVITESFYSASLTPLGMRIPSTGATIVWTNTTPIPATVKVGDSAVLTSGNLGSITYLVEADTATSVFVKVVAQTSDMTATSTYSLTADGTLKLVEHEIMRPGITYILSPR